MFFLLQITMSEIKIESLKKQLIEENFLLSTESIEYLNSSAHNVNFNGDKNLCFRESEAILVIKRLQEQVFHFLLILSVISLFPKFI